MPLASLAFALLLAQGPTPPVYEEPSRRDDGYREGFRDGYAKGYREGQEAARRPPPPPPPPVLGPITVMNARYGSDKKHCNATRWVARQANGRRTASLEVSNSICGDPDFGARKELEVAYRCGPVERTASQREHRTLYLNCAS